MTVPCAVALGAPLVLVVTVTCLVPTRDWLGVLPQSAATYVPGCRFAPVGLFSAAICLVLRVKA